MLIAPGGLDRPEPTPATRRRGTRHREPWRWGVKVATWKDAWVAPCRSRHASYRYGPWKDAIVQSPSHLREASMGTRPSKSTSSRSFEAKSLDISQLKTETDGPLWNQLSRTTCYDSAERQGQHAYKMAVAWFKCLIPGKA